MFIVCLLIVCLLIVCLLIVCLLIVCLFVVQSSEFGVFCDGFWQEVSPESRFIPYMPLVRKSLKGVHTVGGVTNGRLEVDG